MHGNRQQQPQSQLFHPQYLVDEATTTVELLLPCIFPLLWLFRFCSRAAILALVSASRRISFFNFSSSKSRFMSSSFAGGAVATGCPSTWTLSVDCKLIFTASNCDRALWVIFLASAVHSNHLLHVEDRKRDSEYCRTALLLLWSTLEILRLIVAWPESLRAKFVIGVLEIVVVVATGEKKFSPLPNCARLGQGIYWRCMSRKHHQRFLSHILPLTLFSLWKAVFVEKWGLIIPTANLV